MAEDIAAAMTPPSIQELASKLGVTEEKLTEALRTIREENRSTTKPAPEDRPTAEERDAELAKALAEKLGLDEAKVAQALAEIRTARQAERAAALKERLDAAVADGTLTQAEADAVTKAVEKGVIGGRRLVRAPVVPPLSTSRARPGGSNTCSKLIGEPSGLLSGTRQFGYSSMVPGWFWALRSPTASVSATHSSRDGVSVR